MIDPTTMAAGETSQPGDAEMMTGNEAPESTEEGTDNEYGSGEETLGTVPLSFFGDKTPQEGATETVKIVSVDQQSGTVDIVCVQNNQPASKMKGAAGLADEFNS